jgi:hypothetical protein
VRDACWLRDEDVPYRALATALAQIEDASGRLDKIEILRNFLQSVIVLTPRDLAKCIMLASNTLAPAFKGVELGVGDSILMKVREHLPTNAFSPPLSCLISLARSPAPSASLSS